MNQTRRLAAILAADVAGYSRLMGEDEAGTLARLQAHRRELSDPKVAEHKGRVHGSSPGTKTTDEGWFFFCVLRRCIDKRGGATMLGKSIIGVIAAALAAILTPAALAQEKGEIVRIQDYPGIGNMLYRIAATKGYCEKHGITCRLQMIPSGPLGTQALLAKSIDVAFIGPDIQIAAMIKGARLKAIVSGASGNPFLIVIRNDLEAPNAGNGYPAFMVDLKGKRIGVPARGAAAEFQFVVLAQKAGLKAEDFIFVAVGSPNTAYGALISKQVDAEMSFPPSDALCDVLKTCRTIYRAYQSKERPEASVNMVVTQETIDKRPRVVDALIAAEDSESFIQNPNNYAEALKIAQSYFKFNMPRGDEVMDAALKRYFPLYKAAISRPALKAIADNMLATKQIEAPFDATALVYAKAP